MTEEELHAVAVEERNRRGRLVNELGHEARCFAHEHDAEYIWARLERRGTTRTRAEVEQIMRDYDLAPHCHAVMTLHTFGSPCSLGREHRGCCPKTPGCNHPGWYPE